MKSNNWSSNSEHNVFLYISLTSQKDSRTPIHNTNPQTNLQFQHKFEMGGPMAAGEMNRYENQLIYDSAGKSTFSSVTSFCLQMKFL